MPIQLTTPFDTGAIDSGSYGQVKIIAMNIDLIERKIDLRVQHGNTVNDEWVSGIIVRDITSKDFTIRDTDYTTIIATESEAAEELYYDKVADTLYQWLIDNAHYIGTIV